MNIIESVKQRARLEDYWQKAGGKDTEVSVIRCTRPTVKADAGERLITLVATTEHVDVDDEVIVAAGAAPDSYFFKNRSVFVDHWYDLSSFVGKVRRFIPRPNESNQTSWEVQIRLNKDHPFTPMILSLAEDGGIGSSIGFARLEGGKPTEAEVKQYTGPDGRKPEIITRRWEWIEQSITAMPANVHAQSVGFDAAKSQMLDSYLTKGAISREFAVLLGLPEKKKRVLYPTVTSPKVVHVIDM